jgi:hypothetical protein
VLAFKDVSVLNSTISGNTAFGTGGGIDSVGGPVDLFQSTVSGNLALTGGGGIMVTGGGTTHMIMSTVSGNTAASGAAGGIFAHAVELITSTVSGNRAAAGGGGGIAASLGTIRNSTIAENFAAGPGGGVLGLDDFSPIHVKNSIIAENLNLDALFSDFRRDVSGVFVSEGHNLIGVVDGSTGFGAAGDLLGTVSDPLDPLLGPLAFNGGPTQTHALLAGSPAIDHGINSDDALATDQRGVARPRDGDGNGSLIIDIGAFER